MSTMLFHRQTAGVIPQPLVLHCRNPYNSLSSRKGEPPKIVMLCRLRELFRVAKHIFQTEGVPPLLRRGFAFLISHFFQYETYYLYEIDIPKVLKKTKETNLLPKIQDFILKIVYTNEQADELDREGFEFRSQLINARKKLDKGAIAFCIFVGHELASIGWITLNNAAKDSLIDLPLQVDFPHREVCTGGAVTNPKYRNRGLMRYNYFKRLELLEENGWRKDRAAVAKSNIAAQAGVARIGGVNIYAEARFLELLCWKFWREKPLTPPGM